MAVRILHCADLHLDSPFDSLPGELAIIRRREQRTLIKRIADIAESEAADIVLMAGDLFDSLSFYAETKRELIAALGRIRARVFIAPGNHDFISPRSPYMTMEFPENVHVFRSDVIDCVELEELGVRVWGAGFTNQHMAPMLGAFRAPQDGMINVMVLHGSLGGDYNAVTEDEIAATGLDYLALGHEHTYSGIRRAGKTFYAYPGCTEGRGFDETGEKGLITGTVSKGSVSLGFRPLGGRRYTVCEIDMTDCDGDETEFVRERIPESVCDDVLRLVLKGESDGRVDPGKLEDMAFFVTTRDRTRPRRAIWDGIDDDTLRGEFLRIMRARYDSGDENALLAVRYGLSALDSGEDFSL